MLVDITVVPNSPKFRIARKDGAVKIYLRSPAEKNKANAELMRELEKIFGKPVRIVSGATSRKKRVELPVDEAQWTDFLSKIS